MQSFLWRSQAYHKSHKIDFTLVLVIFDMLIAFYV